MKLLKSLSMFVLMTIFAVSCDSDDDVTVEVEGDSDTSYANSVFTSSNESGDITVLEVENLNNVSVSTIGSGSSDTEGIYFDSTTNEVVQVSRSSGAIESYTEISLDIPGLSLNATASSSASLMSPRDLAVNGNFFVVADNADVDGDATTADGRFFIFTRNTSGEFDLRNTVVTDFAVWGIEFDGDTLVAVVDKTSDVAIFEDFIATNTTDGNIQATKRITIEGIVRTHGLAIDAGTLILTDIGDATIDNDGGFHIITDYASKFNSVADGETLLVANNQVRVAGSSTFLGNPVAAEYDADSNVVFIAERANGGGRVLAFSNADAGGNLTPDANSQISGASSIYFNE